MKPFRALVLDLDGTLVDSYDAVTSAMNAARRAFGRPPLGREELSPRVGHPLEELVRDLVDADVAAGVRIFRETYARVFREQTQPLAGVAEALERFAARGIRMGVASNKPSRFARPLLESFGMAPPIEVVLGPEDGVPPKPAPAMILRVLERLGVPAGQALYVGDTPLDVESAGRAGVDVVLVATGGHSERTLAETGALVLPGLVALACGETADEASGLRAAPNGRAPGDGSSPTALK